MKIAILLLALTFMKMYAVPWEELVTQLPSGYKVSTSDPARITRGRWRVFMTMRDNIEHVHYQRQILRRQAVELQQRIKNYSQCESTSNECIARHQIAKWSVLLEMFRHDEERVYAVTRSRRGLINILGHGLKWLTGTATESDIAEVKSLIAKARRQQTALIHNQIRMSTLIDNANKQHKADHARIKEMWRVVVNTTAMTHAIIDRLTLNNHRAQIEALVTYHAQMREELRILEIEHQQVIQDLTNGLVTDLLLSKELYQQITQMAIEHTLEAMSLPWLYHYGHAELLVVEHGQLVYAIDIPLTDRISYLRYRIDTWPVPINNNTTKELIVCNDIAYNTETGDIFPTGQCKGKNPVVCPSSPLYTEQYFRCERGLIAGHMADAQHCAVRTNEGIVSAQLYLSQSTWILITPQDTIELHEQEKPPRKYRLMNGVYEIRLPARSTLRGTGWKVTGQVINNFAINDTKSTVNVPTLDIDSVFKTTTDSIVIPSLAPWSDDENDTNNNGYVPYYDNLQDDLDKLFDEHVNLSEYINLHARLNWAKWALIICIIVILLLVTIFVISKREWLKYYIQALPN